MIGSLKKRADRIVEQVPGTVNELKVVSYDHVTPMGYCPQPGCQSLSSGTDQWISAWFKGLSK